MQNTSTAMSAQNVVGVSPRARKRAPSRKGCAANGQMTINNTSNQMSTPPAPTLKESSVAPMLRSRTYHLPQVPGITVLYITKYTAVLCLSALWFIALGPPPPSLFLRRNSNLGFHTAKPPRCAPPRKGCVVNGQMTTKTSNE